MCVKTHKSAPNYVPLHHMDMHKVAGFILGETLNRASKQVRQIYIYIYFRRLRLLCSWFSVQCAMLSKRLETLWITLYRLDSIGTAIV